MAAIHFTSFHPSSSSPPPPPSSSRRFSSPHFHFSSSSFPNPTPPALRSISRSHTRKHLRSRLIPVSALGKLSDTDLVSVPPDPEGLEGKFPSGSGLYGVYDSSGELQFIGITRNIAASVAAHRRNVPDLCCSVKVGLMDEPAADRTALSDAWKSWMQEHIESTGKVPPGNESGNNTWLRQPQKKPDLRLTPGRHVQLTVPLEELIDRLVKENRVVAFIKGTRTTPQCGFSQRVVGILESQGVDFECVNVLDEECNSGLREALKSYSNWPTFPQIFVKGELLGGCDILCAMEEKGELSVLFEK